MTLKKTPEAEHLDLQDNLKKCNIHNQTFGGEEGAQREKQLKRKWLRAFEGWGCVANLRSTKAQKTGVMVRDRFEYLLFKTQEMKEKQKNLDYSP